VHQVEDQTKVILRCTVNQPSRTGCLDTLLLKINIRMYKRWDTSVGKATSYWPDSPLVDVYITYTFRIISGSVLRNAWSL